MEINVVRQLDTTHSEVLCKNKFVGGKEVVRHFSVPTEKQDEFISEFKQQNKKISIWSNIGLFGSALVGALLGGKVFKKALPSLISAAVAAFGAGLGAVMVTGNIAGKAQKNLFDKFGVEERVYLKEENKEPVKNEDSAETPKTDEKQA